MENPVTYIPDVDGYALELRYKNIRILPKITVITSPSIELSGDGSMAVLLSFVQAIDLNGVDISDRITVVPTEVDTEVSGMHPVTYTVTDDWGNVGVLEVDISVGQDWYQFPLGNDWVLGDFTYDGNKVTGFSESGLVKVQTNKDLILPHLNPTDGVTPIDTVADIKTDAVSFRSKGLTSLTDYDTATGGTGNIKVIEGNWSADNSDRSSGQFINNRISTLSLPALEFMGAKAFEGNPLGRVNFPNLTWVGASGLRNTGLTVIEAGDLPSLQETGTTAFGYNTQLTSVSLPSLLNVNALVFQNVPLTDVYFPSVNKIYASGFAGAKFTSIDETMFPAVKILASSAFSQVNTVTYIELPSLEEIEGRAFPSVPSNVVFADNLPNLKIIGSSALRNLNITELHIPKLESIGSGAFAETPELMICATHRRSLFGQIRIL